MSRVSERMNDIGMSVLAGVVGGLWKAHTWPNVVAARSHRPTDSIREKMFADMGVPLADAVENLVTFSTLAVYAYLAAEGSYFSATPVLTNAVSAGYVLHKHVHLNAR